MFATPEEAEHAFYEALEQADVVRLMQVWADDEEVVCIHPGGSRIKSAIRRCRNPGNRCWPTAPAYPPAAATMLSMMCAVHVLVEQVAVRTREGTQFANCYVTNIYHKGPTGWRMVMHHASPAPTEAGVLDLHDVPDMLH